MELINELKIWLVDWTGLAKDALHIYVAVGVFLAGCALFGWKAWQLRPLLLVLAVAIAGEFADIAYNLTYEGYAFLRSSVHDIWNTMLVPCIIFLFAKFSVVFARPAPGMTEKSGDQPEV
ncbi:hypothetical protein GRI43_03565 [Altererythrobacter luteolus]|uniref:Uncharacterized protein n=1 Tax=Pontixanthobacter luteolus TaxID=295089 RepID=A0A6I4V3B7_9SPHN|nr:hypothetical protein [Pontixanthobacter luteolus]MXP46472.1 hypothetical protein [Pontixanthobacter luteolus]